MMHQIKAELLQCDNVLDMLCTRSVAIRGFRKGNFRAYDWSNFRHTVLLLVDLDDSVIFSCQSRIAACFHAHYSWKLQTRKRKKENLNFVYADSNKEGFGLFEIPIL